MAFKKFTCLCVGFCMSLVLMTSGRVQAMENSNVTNAKASDSVKAKIALKEKADKKYKSNTKNIVVEDETKQILLTTLASDPAADKEKIKEELETYGVYMLENTTENIYTPMAINSDNTDVTINSPMISYDASTGNWTVTGGGYWKNNDWFNDITNVWWGYTGETKDVGSRDGFGVGYSSISGEYKSYVVKQYAMMSDGQGRKIETTNRSDGDGSKGFGFELQDYIRLNTVDGWADAADCSYIGKHFAGQVTYNSQFTYLNGNATTYYFHTSKNAEITNVNFGVEGKTAGVGAEISNVSDSFPAYSTDSQF